MAGSTTQPAVCTLHPKLEYGSGTDGAAHTLLSPCRYLSQQSKTVYFSVALKRYKDLFSEGDGSENDIDWLLARIPDKFDMDTVLGLRHAALKYIKKKKKSLLK